MYIAFWDVIQHFNQLFLVEHEFAMPGSAQLDSHGQKMTNEDFRKLMMTPRSSGPASLASGSSSLGSGVAMTPAHSGAVTKTENSESSDKAEKRKKKKSYYAKLKRQEDDKMAELAAKYRDRAQVPTW